LASGGFAKQSLKAAVSFVMPVAPPFPLFIYPSVRPRLTTRLPPGGFSLAL
jgi:hypothetical protein